ncbi:DsbA family protein [Peredibacter starrii]|uniref:Thioredoxin domain-containing protein n=1 Tax=Peredibacter starrii TaxID=28202 RepID=A0AAX4HV88_9BACT|nr:thioredoxin domain-containing protein [Peredibacter starrii]WPU66870.1 thioredoxin domain-containing protein [Peredibacter starrii]
MKNKIMIVLIALMSLAIVFMVGTKLYKGQEQERLSFMAKSDFSTFVRDYSPRLGRADAKVYVVEFLDPECESCREFYSSVKMLLQEYEGKIQLVVRYAPFHGNSIFIIKILEAARKQNRYWETLETLFRYQPEWGNHHHPRPELVWNYLPEAGVNVEQIKKDMEDPAIQSMIEQEIADGRALNVQATPTFFVNGRPLERFGYEGLKDLVESTIRAEGEN